LLAVEAWQIAFLSEVSGLIVDKLNKHNNPAEKRPTVIEQVSYSRSWLPATLETATSH
jgi:hypothetical protein